MPKPGKRNSPKPAASGDRAAHFPAIEKKYGKPIEHWMKELKKVSKLTHMEQVAHLKDKFEMGHGHANESVAVFRKEM